MIHISRRKIPCLSMYFSRKLAVLTILILILLSHINLWSNVLLLFLHLIQQISSRKSWVSKTWMLVKLASSLVHFAHTVWDLSNVTLSIAFQSLDCCILLITLKYCSVNVEFSARSKFPFPKLWKCSLNLKPEQLAIASSSLLHLWKCLQSPMPHTYTHCLWARPQAKHLI